MMLPVLAGTAFGAFADLGEDCTVPVPPGWALLTETTDFPFHLVADDLGAEVLIFKSDISHNETIDNEADLRKSVEAVLDEVIPDLPQSLLLSSSGYYEQSRAAFVLDFMSTAPPDDMEIHHRLRGVLYRLPDGHQLLFTLWAKAPSGTFQNFEGSISIIQEGFAYRGEHEANVFAAPRRTYLYPLGAVVLVMGLVLWMRSRKTGRGRLEFEQLDNVWRCECGRLNHEGDGTCRRCGRPQVPRVTI